MRLQQKQAEFLMNVSKLIQFIFQQGFEATGGELHRTPEQQALHKEAGRSMTSNSLHLDRLAIDLNIFRNGKLIQSKATLQPIGDFWESLNPRNRWGGNFRSFLDTPHFERRR